MSVANLKARLTRLQDEARSLIASPANDNGDLSAEQQTRLDELKPSIEQLRSNIKTFEQFEEADRQENGRFNRQGLLDDDFDRVPEEYSIVRAIAGASGMEVDDGYEREVSAELAHRAGKTPQGIMVPTAALTRRVRPMEKRVLTGAGDAADIISTDHMGNQFIDLLRAKMVMGKLGARTLSGLKGNTDIPRMASNVASGWRAENSAFPEGDHAFDDVNLTPKSVGLITTVSRNVLLQSSPDIEQLVRSDFAAVLAREIDRVALIGGGTNEPVGVLATSGIGDVDMSATITWAKVLELIELVESADGDVEAGGFVMNAKVKTVLRNTPRQAAGVEGSFIMGLANELAGYQALTTSQAINTTAPLIFGDFSDVLIGMWSGVDILVNPYESTAYKAGNVMIRGIMTADVGIRHAESFAAATEVVGGV